MKNISLALFFASAIMVSMHAKSQNFDNSTKCSSRFASTCDTKWLNTSSNFRAKMKLTWSVFENGKTDNLSTEVHLKNCSRVTVVTYKGSGGTNTKEHTLYKGSYGDGPGVMGTVITRFPDSSKSYRAELELSKI